MPDGITDLPADQWTHEQNRAFREAWDAKVLEVHVLNTEAGELRAQIDNLQAELSQRSAISILDLLTQEGFDRLCSAFPQGLRESGNPIRPTDTAISVTNALVRRVAKRDEEIAALDAALDDSKNLTFKLAIELARTHRALAEYAMRAVEAAYQPAEVTE